MLTAIKFVTNYQPGFSMVVYHSVEQEQFVRRELKQSFGDRTYNLQPCYLYKVDACAASGPAWIQAMERYHVVNTDVLSCRLKLG